LHGLDAATGNCDLDENVPDRNRKVLQIKHNSESGVDAAQFFGTEITHAVAESTRIDCRGLFS
jgi:hypothetical protein